MGGGYGRIVAVAVAACCCALLALAGTGAAAQVDESFESGGLDQLPWVTDPVGGWA
ncbi:MAG: hypothetical protein HYV63_31750, partial [Candidatus Schekmanbacteria bacterium]|nr:hypothetical protein [Candidatus Schekmanbacteria bacterium]